MTEALLPSSLAHPGQTLEVDDFGNLVIWLRRALPSAFVALGTHAWGDR
jgi:hypothetical protein